MNDTADPAAQPAARFADGKDESALRTIGEVAAALGIRQHVLRYWEEQFPTLRPLKRSGGRRLYRAEDVALVETIHRLVHRDGYTLKGAKQALKVVKAPAEAAHEVPPAPVPNEPAQPISFALRARLISLRTSLVNALHEA